MIWKSGSSKTDAQLDVVVNRIRKWRTLSLKVGFSFVIAKDIIMGNKPHELAVGPELSAWAVVGAVLVLAGVAIRTWARGHFERGRLFTTGPYALVRHPLYLGSLLIVIGVLCQLNNWLNWVIMLPLFGLSHGIAIIWEERSLARRFGDAWWSYAGRVPALVPSLKGLLNVGGSDKWSWRRFLHTRELATTVIVMSLPLLIEVLENIVFEGIMRL
jgi:protein-S-isoprenylcysteine O-methyltransferase Ste14